VSECVSLTLLALGHRENTFFNFGDYPNSSTSRHPSGTIRTRKTAERQSYNDILGVQLGQPGQILLSFGVAKGARYPVNIPLNEKIPLTNNSAVDRRCGEQILLGRLW